MITVQEAKNIIASQCKQLETVYLPVVESVGYCLANTISSPVNIPSFPQSSMDGYAIRIAEIAEKLIIQDELPAGSSKQISLEQHAAIKVFTGGPVPAGADTIVQKEKVINVGDAIQINTKDSLIGDHIRKIGADIHKGDIALPAQTIITPMQIGFIASMGIQEGPVVRKPKVAILVTGNELVQPGQILQPGQIYDSNSFALKACLTAVNISSVEIFFANDTLLETKNCIEKALATSDILLITGGVSVGDYDFVADACTQLGIKKQFHGVKQRPGKPLYFGTTENTLVFGLPGNPASVLSCFYQYVLPAICQFAGIAKPIPLIAKLKEAFEKKPALTFFLKGCHSEGMVSVLPAQASFQQSAFVQANCWIELPEAITTFEMGHEVNIYPFI